MLALFVWALATYGFVVGLLRLIRCLRASASPNRRIVLVLIVCNGEFYIEGILRVIAYKAFLYKKDLRMVVMDTGSRDATREIVSRMAERDSRIELIETDGDFDAELIGKVRTEAGWDSSFALFDLRGWKNPRNLIPGLTRIVE